MKVEPIHHVPMRAEYKSPFRPPMQSRVVG